MAELSDASIQPAAGRVARRPFGPFRNLTAKIAALPMIATALIIFVGCTLWTVFYSFTSSRLLPVTKFVGFDQYERLFGQSRWLQAIENIAIFGVLSLVLSLGLGFFFAALFDQKIRFENTFRTIFLYPYALSFIVTGIAWQWILAPDHGIQQVVRDLGWTTFEFAPLISADWVIYGVLIAGIWQGSGFVTVLLLAGLRGVDEEIWKASRIDGIPTWRTYVSIILPMMRPVFVTALVVVAAGIVRVYDLVVAQTGGGPGIASSMPAMYVYDFMFGRGNLGQAFAASTVMLGTVLIILVPWALLEFGGKRRQS